MSVFPSWRDPDVLRPLPQPLVPAGSPAEQAASRRADLRARIDEARRQGGWLGADGVVRTGSPTTAVDWARLFGEPVEAMPCPDCGHTSWVVRVETTLEGSPGWLEPVHHGRAYCRACGYVGVVEVPSEEETSV